MKVNRASKSGRPINHVRQGKNSLSRDSYIERPEKAKSSQMRADDNESSRLLSIDIVYEKLQHMKDEYKQFYSEEQSFEEAWASLQDDPDHFIDHLLEIFEAHNHVVEALIDFDKTFETDHLEALIDFVNRYEFEFSDLKIIIQPDASLRVRKRILRDLFNKSPERFNFLTSSGGFLKKLFDFYHRLKAIKPPTTVDEDQLAWYQGLFVDQKA